MKNDWEGVLGFWLYTEKQGNTENNNNKNNREKELVQCVQSIDFTEEVEENGFGKIS